MGKINTAPGRKGILGPTIKKGGVVFLPGATAKNRVAKKPASSHVPPHTHTSKSGSAAAAFHNGSEVFTIADAIKQCANTVIARSAANPTSNYRNYVVDEKTYINLWASLCLFLRNHNSKKPNFSVLTPNQHHVPSPVNIIGIGVASHRSFNLGIKIPVFDLSQKFAVKYDLVQPKSISNGRPAPSSTFKIGAKDLIDPSWNINEEKAEFAMQSLVECIGGALKSGRPVKIDFGIGTLDGNNSVCVFNFTQRPDAVGAPDKKWNIGISGRVLSSPRTRRISEAEQSMTEKEELAKKFTLDVKNLPSPDEPTLSFSKEPTPRPNSSPTHHIDSKQLETWVPIFSKKGPPILSPAEQSDGEAASFRVKRSGSISFDAVFDETAPPLLNEFARLKCSTISGSDVLSSPCDKIGSYFSPTAAALYLDKTMGRISWVEGVKRGGDADQLVDVKPEDDVFGLKAIRKKKEGEVKSRERAESKREIVRRASMIAINDDSEDSDRGNDGNDSDENADVPDSVEEPEQSAHDDGTSPKLSTKGAKRYLHYLNKGSMKNDLIAPFDKALMENLRFKFTSTPPAKLAAFLKEIDTMYSDSINKATLDYLLLSEAERTRLSIEEIPADVRIPSFGNVSGNAIQQPPDIWRTAFTSVKEAHEERGIILAPLTIVNAMWQEFSHLKLVSVPTNYKESLEQDNVQMTVIQFEDSQIAHIQSVVEEFRNNWLVGLRNMFEDCVENTGAASRADLVDRYIRAWTVAMQSQLRSVISRSVESFLAFFEMFALKDDGTDLERRVEGNRDVEMADFSEFEYKRPPPPFIIDLMAGKNANDSIKLSTSLDQVIERVENIFNAITGSFDDFETMHNLTRGGKTKRLKITSKREPSITAAKRRIIDIVEENMIYSMNALERYSTFEYLFDSKATEVDADTHLEDVEAAITRFTDSSKEIQTLPSNIPIVLINFEASHLHKSLINMTESSRLSTIDKIVQKCMTVNHDVAKAGRILWSKLNKKPTTTDELVESEGFLLKVKSMDLPALETEVSVVREQVHFLLAQQSLYGDTLDTVNGTFRQLRELKAQFERADQISHNQRISFETNCRNRKKQLQGQLGKVEAAVNEFNFKADMKSMVQKYLEELDNLSKQLHDSKLSAGIINQEEAKLGWNTTEFMKIAEVEGKMEPYKNLWNIALTFRSEYASWTRSPIFNLDGEEVEKNFNMMLEKMTMLKELFENKDAVGPANVAETIIEKLDSYAIYIPLIKALTNKRLNELHWKSIGDILGFEISKDDASISWTNLMAQGALSEENIQQIKELNDTADREVDIRIFTEYVNKMDADAALFSVVLGVDSKHPWAQSLVYIIDKENMDDVMKKVERHLINIEKIEENKNGKEFIERCKGYKKLFDFVAHFGGLLLETEILWFDLVHSKQLTKEQRHQINHSDEAWRALVTELVVVEGITDVRGAGGEKLVQGLTFRNLEGMEESHLVERTKEIFDLLTHIKKGEDARKVMRRMSRRQSNMTKATKTFSTGGLELRKALDGIGKKS